MTKWGKRLVSLLCAAMLALCCACTQGGGGDGYKAERVRIQISDSYGTAIAQILMRTGLLEELLPKNVEVEWVTVIGGTAARDALATGSLDIAHLADPVVIGAIENGLPVTLLARSVVSCGQVWGCREDIGGVEDIGPGDKLATTSLGSINHLSLMLYCRDTYGDPAMLNNNLIVMERADSMAAMATSRELAGVITSFPYNLRAEEVAGARMVLDLTPVMKQYAIGSYVAANRDFCADNPALVEAVEEAYRRTIEFMNESPQEAAGILAETYADISIEDIEDQLRAIPPVYEISETSYDTVAGLMYEVGILAEPPTPFAQLPGHGEMVGDDKAGASQ